MAIIRSREFLNEDGSVPVELLVNCIAEHQTMIPRYNKLYNYYIGEHSIKNRVMQGEDLPNNRLICNHAEYITDMATGYILGNPITYKADGIEDITENFKSIDIHSHDTELSRDISIYGIGYELAYMSTDESPIPKISSVDPRSTFLVVDDTVEYKPIFGVNYHIKQNIKGETEGYTVEVYTETNKYTYLFKDIKSRECNEISTEEHFFGIVPIIEYWNKKTIQGDFEQVISLIDAYNLLQSDRVNDKEQLVDALLAIYGASLGDDEEEVTQTAKAIKKHKILELPSDGKAEWLIKQLNETEVEVLKKSIKDDIHEFSKVPCLTDENFASQASGVAMKYKLLGLEQLAKTKESFYKQGLRERLQLFANIHNTKGKNIDISNIEIIMTRSLPVNEVELANMIVNLDGTVSLETRLGLLPFVGDIETEMQRIAEEKKERLQEQQEAFGFPENNTSPDDNTEEDEE